MYEIYPCLSNGLVVLLLLPLAVASTKAMMKRLGGHRRQVLHRAVYAIGIFAVLLALLLGMRLDWALRSGPGRHGVS